MQDQEPCFPLLSLPQLPLTVVARSLNKHDRQSLAGVCRSLATAVSVASPSTQVTVRSSTGWKGLSQVLATRTVACKRMLIISDEPLEHETIDANSALGVMLKPDEAPSCSFPGIHQVCINVGLQLCKSPSVHPLPCLLPANIASLLPDLTELSVYCEPGQYTDHDDPQPLPYFSGLHKLTLETSIGLPGRYHTSEDLRQRLPNVTSLELMQMRRGQATAENALNCVDTMVRAWAEQLTELNLHTGTALIELQQYTRLKHLSGDPKQLRQFPTSLPQSLTNLDLRDVITESALQTILLLPVLRKFSIHGFTDKLRHDWSKHPCTWHKLCVDRLDMEDLSKLPLHSLTGTRCLEAWFLELPDPMLPDSFVKVMHAVQCVRNASIMIEGLRDWECIAWKTDQLGTEVDIASADMFCAASRVVQPMTVYQTHKFVMQEFPRTKAAMIKWMSPKLQILNIRDAIDIKSEPWFWKALQNSTKLSKLIFQKVIPNIQSVDRIIILVLQAAEHLVAVTRRPIMLVFTLCKQGSQEEVQEATSHLLSSFSKQLPDCVSVQDCFWECNFLHISLHPTQKYTWLPAWLVKAFSLFSI